MPEITENTPLESDGIDNAETQEIAQIKDEVDRLLGITNILVGDLSNGIKTKAHASALLSALESAYLTVGREMNEATGLGCPDGWFQCNDGSCVEDSSRCPGGNNAA